MLRKSISKLQAAVEILLVPIQPGVFRQCFFVRPVGENCGISSLGRLLVLLVDIGSLLIFPGRLFIVIALKQGFREQKICIRTVSLSREGIQVGSIPVGRLKIIFRLAIFLGFGVIILRQVRQAALEMCFDSGV